MEEEEEDEKIVFNVTIRGTQGECGMDGKAFEYTWS